MEFQRRNVISALFCAGVIVSIILLYTPYDKQTHTLSGDKLFNVLTFKDMQSSMRELNKVAALAGIGLIATAFILGPLSRMFPVQFAQYLPWRKFVGIAGFALAALHSVYSMIEFYRLDIGMMLFSNPNLPGFVSGAIGLLIFLAMALTANGESVKRLGYRKWKALQTFGYAGLFLAIVHFVMLETKPDVGFDVRPYALLFLFIALVALLVRIGMTLVKVPQRESFGEHTGDDMAGQDLQPPKK